MNPDFDQCFAELRAKNLKHIHSRDFDGVEYISVDLPSPVVFKGGETSTITIIRTDSTSEYELFLKHARRISNL